MRLVATLQDPQQAERFSLFLLERGVENQVETRAPNQTVIWVFDEDSVKTSQDFLNEFLKNPHWVPSPALVRKKREEQLLKEAEAYMERNPEGLNEEAMQQSPLENDPMNQQPPEESGQPPQQEQVAPRSFGKLTVITACACVLLYFWAFLSTPSKVDLPDGQSFASSFMFTKPYNQLMFEQPLAYQYASQFFENLRVAENPELFLNSQQAAQDVRQFQNSPYWHGYYETYMVPESSAAYSLNQAFTAKPQFEQIAQGQIWRIFTPALLHANFFHILFNLIWFIFLGRQIEERIGFFRYGFFLLFAAGLTNTFQYLMSGPNFLGLSGVVLAQAGYIWMRQTVAAWEGYSVQKPTLYFLGFYVLVLVGIQTASFVLELNGYKGIAPNIANTAHVAGAVIGLTLGRMNFLSAWRLGRLKK